VDYSPVRAVSCQLFRCRAVKRIVESVKKGVSKTETTRRFGVDRATVKRYCKQFDERDTFEPTKAPGKRPKLDEKRRKLFLEDLEQRP
jgi:transposase